MSVEDQYADDDDATGRSREELLTQLEILTEENQQLRTSYTQAKQTQYQRTAAGLGLLGIGALIAGVVVQSASDVLFVLGGIGLFGGVLTYYITPEQFVSADVGREIYATLAANEAAIVSELGLTDTRLYVPTDNGVRLFIPQSETDSLPDTGLLEQTIVVPSDETARGLALAPSGTQLFSAFEDALTGRLAATPGTLAEQLSDAIVEQFELAAAVTPEIDDGNAKVIIAVSGSVYGPGDHFDHPIPSFLATGLAHGLDQPVTVTIMDTANEQAEFTIVCQWREGSEQSTSSSEA